MPRTSNSDLLAQAQKSSSLPPTQQILLTFQQFAHNEAVGGIFLLLSAVVAIVWANSPGSALYQQLLHVPIIVGVGDWVLDKPLLLWINDGLMAVFFFVVGLEIKRELLVGELATPRKAILPIAAAVGGMILPAVLYLTLNSVEPGLAGWGIPMATDIAFALGVLALLGDRVPLALKIFLTALAIVDDLGAVLVIAIFYTSSVSWQYIAIGLGFFLALVFVNLLGVRHTLVYALLGIGGLWLAFLLSGVHPTIAGVLAALTIPARPRLSESEFIGKARTFLKEFEKRTAQHEETVLANAEQAEAAKAVEVSSALAQTPLQRLEHALQPWVSFGIMPMFALANAGVTFGGDSTNTLTQPVSLGILLGLLLGKPIGITLFTWATVQFGWGELPEKVSWRQILGVGMIAGIGFTMSLFITSLAFTESALVASAKMGILIASLIAGIAGWVILKTSHSMNQIGIQGASAMPLGRIQVLNGPVAGKELPLTKPLISLGLPGAQVAVMLRRPQGYSLIHIEGKNDYGPLYPIVNGEPIGPKAFSLQDQDIIEIAGIKMEFTLNERRVS